MNIRIYPENINGLATETLMYRWYNIYILQIQVRLKNKLHGLTHSTKLHWIRSESAKIRLFSSKILQQRKESRGSDGASRTFCRVSNYQRILFGQLMLLRRTSCHEGWNFNKNIRWEMWGFTQIATAETPMHCNIEIHVD